MHGARAGIAGGAEDGAGVEVAAGGRRGADQDRLIRLAHERQPGIGLGVDGDGPDAHPPGGGDHPPGYLTAVGDEHRLHHR